jgi:hypothetical protein
MGTIDFDKVKQIAGAAGATKWAIQKWRQRGIPINWQVALMKREPGMFTFNQFETFNSSIPPKPNKTT